MDFKNKDVAAKYETSFTDRDIFLPCGCQKKLSEITLSDADGMYERGSNLLKQKEVQGISREGISPLGRPKGAKKDKADE